MIDHMNGDRNNCICCKNELIAANGENKIGRKKIRDGNANERDRRKNRVRERERNEITVYEDATKKEKEAK